MYLMPWALLVKPSGLPPQDPYTQFFTYLLWAYVLTDSECSCLAILARPYPVSGPTYIPQIPNLLHRMSKEAHEVPDTISKAKPMSVFHIKNISFLLL